jgi:hypothetical protein
MPYTSSLQAAKLDSLLGVSESMRATGRAFRWEHNEPFC